MSLGDALTTAAVRSFFLFLFVFLSISPPSYHEDYLKAEETCNKAGAYLADILDAEEANFIKSVLNVINPKDGTDYWLGGLDADRDHGLQWISGAEMVFNDFVKDKPNGLPYLHMNYDNQFK